MNHFQLLRKLLAYADENVEYYHRLFQENNIDISKITDLNEFQTIPFLDKNSVQKNINQLLSDEYQQYPHNTKMDIRRTSGSTGNYLKVCWGLIDNARSMMSIWKIRNQYYGINHTMSYCSFYSVNYIGNKIFEQEDMILDSHHRHLAFSKIGLTNERLLECYQKILEFNPYWFSLQPSMAVILAELVLENKLPLPTNLKYIELNGELLTDQCRALIQKAFPVQIANMYGCNETNAIAIEHNDRILHVLQNNVLVEVIRNGSSVVGQEGDICVTSLQNHAMPFIRYFLGDRGIINEDSNGSQWLTLSSGRDTDYIILKDGQKISSYILVSIIQYTNEYMESAIKQYQIRQKTPEEFDVVLALKPAYKGWESSVTKAFLSNIEEPSLKTVQWNFQFVDTIYPDEKTGKLKYFIPLSCTKG